MKTLQQFIRETHTTMKSERVDSNPQMSDPSWPADHWKCVLRVSRAQMTVYFSKGVGHDGKRPGVDEVLDCLASDASSVDNARGFEDWCSELGYDTDSRKAEKTFKTCEEQARKLKALLGDSAYRTLLYETERL
jgi:hypothetical protein